MLFFLLRVNLGLLGLGREYSNLSLPCDEQNVRIDIAVGEEHLFLSLLSDTDSPHCHICLTRLHGGNLSGEVHHEKFQFVVALVLCPLCQEGWFQTRQFSRIDEVEWWHCGTGIATRRVRPVPTCSGIAIAEGSSDFCQRS